MKIKTSKNDMKILYVLLAISIILFISLTLFNYKEKIATIYDKTFKSVDELSIDYELVNNDDLNDVDFTVTVSSGNELEYVKYPDGQKIGLNNRNSISFDYNGINQHTYSFEVKEKGKTQTNLSFVLDANVYATGVSIAPQGQTNTVYAGYGTQFLATVYPENTTNKTLSWSSSNTSVATIDSTGKVTALRIGSTVITATTTDGTNITSNSYTIYVKALELLNSFDKYIYLDAVYGSDDTGNGTSSKPYKTISSLGKSGVIEAGYSYGVILRDGTYYLNNYVPICTTACTKTINLIGNRTKTKILSTSIIGNTSANVGNAYTVRFYRLVYESTNAGFGWFVGNQRGNRQFYNCIINVHNNPASGSYYFYDGRADFYNCTIIGNRNNLLALRPSSITVCQNNYGYLTYSKVNGQSKDGTFNTNYITSTPQYNSTTYRITDVESVWKNVGTGVDVDGTVADLGVYGGTLSWDYMDDIFY